MLPYHPVKRTESLNLFADSSLPVVALPIGDESRKKLWDKAKLTFQYIYSNHLNDYDWFFKADDDT